MPYPVVSFRLDPDLIARLDEYAVQLREQTGLPVTRNAALAKLIAERLTGPAPKPSPAPQELFKVGQRVIVRWPATRREAATIISGTITSVPRQRKGRPQRYHVEAPACSPGHTKQLNVPADWVSADTSTKTNEQPSCAVRR